MAKKYLGEFEESVLTMVAILEGEGYGKSIVDSFLSNISRKVSLSAVHITLYRLEDKEFVESYLGGATSTRGGRRKRLYRITNAGKELLFNVQRDRQALWKLMPAFKFVFPTLA